VRPRVCRTTLHGNQGRLRLPPSAARTEGPPRIADAPIDQSREAHHPAWPLHSPLGDVTWTDAGTRERRGTPPPRVGNDVGVDVGNDVGVKPPGPRAARDRNDKAAELASEAARAEGASPPPPPTVAGEAWSRAGRQGRLSTPWGAARRRGAGHSPLTAGHRAPSAPRAFRRAWWPACRGETSHGLQPSSSRSDVNAGGRYAQAYAIWAMAARRVGGADYRVVPQGRTAIRRASCWPRARMQVA
jgi:hypothetical protein